MLAPVFCPPAMADGYRRQLLGAPERSCKAAYGECLGLTTASAPGTVYFNEVVMGWCPVVKNEEKNNRQSGILLVEQ
ncbi:hypothetical protein NN561_009738 [Cricetulus griseus]